jgi:hypothetical protein
LAEVDDSDGQIDNLFHGTEGELDARIWSSASRIPEESISSSMAAPDSIVPIRKA